MSKIILENQDGSIMEIVVGKANQVNFTPPKGKELGVINLDKDVFKILKIELTG